jgi:putative acetyltransferase
MAQPTDAAVVRPVTVRDPEVVALIEALDSDLAESEYSESESFGYSTHELEAGLVYLVGASVGNQLVGIGGIELQDGGFAELKRFYVAPGLRGHGLADAILDALERYARDHRAVVLRLETGDRQEAAISFYRRRGFQVVPRFGPYVDSEASVCMQRDLSSHRSTLTTESGWSDLAPPHESAGHQTVFAGGDQLRAGVLVEGVLPCGRVA